MFVEGKKWELLEQTELADGSNDDWQMKRAQSFHSIISHGMHGDCYGKFWGSFELHCVDTIHISDKLLTTHFYLKSPEKCFQSNNSLIASEI